MSEHKISLTDSPVCPFCGVMNGDVWEIDFGAGLDGDACISCGSCGADYQVFRSVDVYYSTYKGWGDK